MTAFRGPMLVSAAAILMGSWNSSAYSAMLQFEIPGSLDRQSVNYECRGGTILSVDYYNLDDTSLAVMPVGETKLVFVNVPSASGAKYVSGAHVWWTRGKRGDLYDESKPDVQPTVCTVTP